MSKPDLKSLLAKRGLRLTDLADLLGLHKSAVTRWHYRQVPADRVLQIEKAAGIKRKHLRPDLYV
jgi:DNA-binding transcriptional regulator YdaS (Cro superfamily)